MQFDSQIVQSPMFLLISGGILTFMVGILYKFLGINKRRAVFLSALVIGGIYGAFILFTPAELKEPIVNFTAQMMGMSWVMYELGLKKLSK